MAQQIRVGPEKTVFVFLCYSFSATMSGSSPWQRYSSHIDAVSQPLLSRRMSSVKVEPGAPMNTLDMAQIVLSSIASTFSMKIFTSAKKLRVVKKQLL